MKNHKHDCNTCLYLGSDSENDYYLHEEKDNSFLSTLICRYGPSGDYSSGLDFVMSNSGINKALKMASEKNVLSEELTEIVKKKQVDFFEYCEKNKDYKVATDAIWNGKERFVLK